MPDLLIILGDSPLMGTELTEFREYFLGKSTVHSHVMAINGSGIKYLDRIDHWATMHPEKMAHLDPSFGYEKTYNFMELRERAGGNADYIVHTPTRIKGVTDLFWNFRKNDGGSAMFGIRVGLCLGFKKIILCGVSLEGDYAHYQEQFDRNMDIMVCKVKSMGGYTEKILGRPNKEWLEVS